MFESLFPSHWTTLRKLMWLKLKGASAVWSTISGNPVSFTARNAPLRQLEVAFSPVQSLNGYDSPWPAGGGKNKYNKDADYYGQGLFWQTTNGALVSSDSYYGSPKIPVQPSTTYTRNESANATLFFDSNGDYLGFESTGKTFTTPSNVYYVAFNIANTVDHAIVQLEIGSSVSPTYSPYSNECPISGWDSLNVEQRGKNLWNPETAIKGFVATNGTFSGQTTAKEYRTDYVVFQKGATYVTLGFNNLADGEQGWIGVGWYKADKTFISRSGTTLSAGTKIASLGVPNNDEIAYAVFCTRTYDHELSGLFATFGRAIPYTPYTGGRSISISLGQTVYSGTVDACTGVGEIDYKLINARDVLWPSSGNVVYTHPSDLYTKITEETPTGRKPLYCNIIKYSANASLAGGGIGYGGINNNGNITVLMTSPWATPEEWTAYIANNDVFICYPLATPIPISLTPQEVQSLAGDNVLFSDANGDLTVEYRSN